MKRKIFITGIPPVIEARKILEAENCITEYGNPKDSAGEIEEKLRKFNPDGLIVRQGKITARVISAAPNLKVISKHGVGYDNIDIEAAGRKGIPVMITPDANFKSVAEHALALLLAINRRLIKQDHDLRKGFFNKAGYNGEEVSSKTIGIIGCGRIGKRLAEITSCLFANHLFYDPYIGSEKIPKFAIHVTCLEDLLKQADIISLHCSLTDETRGLINKKTIAFMKSTTYIINTSRGALIKESDLIEALREKRIAGAALDTFETEPPAKDNPLFKMENVIVTSHVGGASDNSLRNMGKDAVKNVLKVLYDENFDMDSVVNKHLLSRLQNVIE